MTIQDIASHLRAHGLTTVPESHLTGHAGLTVPLPHGAAIWISQDPDAPGFVAEHHRADTDGAGDPIELPNPQHPADIADTIAAAVRSIQARNGH